MPMRKGGMKRRGRRAYRKRGSKGRQGINASYTAPKNFVETIKFKDIISLPGTSGPGGTAYDLSLAPQILPLLNGNLAQVYRQFCIRGIKITYIPSFNNYPQSAGVAQAPKIYFVEDKTALVPDMSSVNVESLLQQDNARVLSPFKKWSEYIKFPKPLLMSGTDATGGAAILQPVVAQLPSNRPMWLSLQDQTELAGEEAVGTEVPHLVGRIVADDNNSAVAITLGKLFYKVYYSVKEQAPGAATTYGALREIPAAV